MRQITAVYMWHGKIPRPCGHCGAITAGIASTYGNTWNIPCGCERGTTQPYRLNEAEIALALLMGPTS